MGILNSTPDSFSDGGKYALVDQALAHALQMVEDGAEIIDIGGESTRPGAQAVSEREELARVVPVIEALREATHIVLSIDTTKPAVAAVALGLGVDIINDVSGFRDPRMIRLAADHGAGCVVMHMQGQPSTMQENPHYTDVCTEVQEFFQSKLHTLQNAGISPEQLVFDPGIGFGKSLEHNLALLAHVDQLSPEGRPLLLGVSRKSFMGRILGDMSLARRSWPTVALTAQTRSQGVRLFRVHEIKPNVDALRMSEAILHA